jgi:hypothetical protein
MTKKMNAGDDDLDPGLDLERHITPGIPDEIHLLIGPEDQATSGSHQDTINLLDRPNTETTNNKGGNNIRRKANTRSQNTTHPSSRSTQKSSTCPRKRCAKPIRSFTKR